MNTIATRRELLRLLPGRIRYRRNQLGITQQELANRLNVHQVSVALWETGKRLPNEDNMIQLAALFRMSHLDLVGSD